jgi:gluconolactonase
VSETRLGHNPLTMSSRLILVAALALLMPLAPATPANRQPLPPVGPIGPVVQVLTGFVETEGSVFDAHGNLYFSDQIDEDGKIYRLGTDGKLTLLVAHSGRANGLAINAAGELVACQMDGRVGAYSLDGARYRLLASSFNGRRFNAPNDLTIDKHGGIYFTDPCFRSGRVRLPQRKTAVYYLAPDGSVTRLIDDLACPNGIELSKDGRSLYVVPSLQQEVMVYTIVAPGKLGDGRVFATIAPCMQVLYIGGDGLILDDHGNVYIATARGVQVFDSAGHSLGIIPVPERPSNLAFGGPERKTLYITAQRSVYAAPMAVSGK